MEIRFQSSPKEVKGMTTAELRANFLVQDLIKADALTLLYTHYDRMIIGGVKPLTKKVELHNEPELRAEYFLERREVGIINVGGAGIVEADGEQYAMNKLDATYLGKGTKVVSFSSVSKDDPACFYLLSAPAHHAYPNRKMTKEEASPLYLGDIATSNKRTLYRYIHLDGIRSCQLVMGLTVLETGCVWNSVPTHTHTRRSEVYLYFDLAAEQRAFHIMGEPQETRHIVMANHEAVISPPWSVHFGSGTGAYGFIWGMAGENQVFTDMDQVTTADLL